ncbi:phosphate ABC transporter substrate-binding protein [Psychrosphaera ytuae]|uniref:Phosphate ABC transporter substrate-binding protein n=1 Tax=Psychrosphaera ytuae TaxID=2820710 RepID=A0A975DBX5_9GAMM|nr:phosphate ABC transporter substrate-binding protein [Psychrosphaera ytuae]QTH64281.1 phosphate ABC transporter substrate-binding protein [Psychrosphaera ytuae]
MKKLTMTLSLLLSFSAFADVAVIVHPSNNSTLDEKAIARIFTGKMKTFPDGSQIIPVNLAAGNAVTQEFNTKALNRSESQLKAYWSKLVFTGKGTPPQEVGSAEEAIKLVASNPNTISFVDASKVTGDVKVALKL